jgi:hypothetical protein
MPRIDGDKAPGGNQCGILEVEHIVLEIRCIQQGGTTIDNCSLMASQ